MSTTPDASGDTIFNGADDDGSGTSALLAMADALHQSSLRPRRSILFVWHCGEEKGLWGSSYFTEHPSVPLNRITAQLNIDMIGRSKRPDDRKPADATLSGPNEIYVIGSRMMSTQLGSLSARVNKGYLNLKFNYTYDDPKDPNRFFYRSDHVNYARKGVPIIFWFDGVHEDYHRRSDEVSKIDFTKMTAVTRTVLVTAAEIADLPQKIVVDKKLTFSERE
jgi:Zn-dependent M28 family amino/carboxypeptidase